MLPYHMRSCRACGASLDTILHLGDLQLSDFPAIDEEPPPRAPLDFCACKACRLVQLRHTVDPDVLFRQYWYRSGINEVMLAELAGIVDQAMERVGRLGYHDLAVDVGANDGTLLSRYRHHDRSIVRVAFEPAANLQTALARHAEVRIGDFFPGAARELRGMRGRVKVLTSIACFYDADDPGAFVAAVVDALHPEGIWIVQFQDLHAMLQATAFDNICHEHLTYYSLASFERLIAPYGLKVLDAEVRAINGGSYRLTVGYGTHKPASDRVEALRQQEAGCDTWEALERFAWRVGELRRQITAAVDNLSQQGQTVDLYGASTKANTLLQYCGLGPDAIRQAWERSPEKVGRQTVTDIPIVDEEAGRADPPDLLLVGIWQFRDAVLQREAPYLQRGGRMLFPMPAAEIVTAHKAVSA